MCFLFLFFFSFLLVIAIYIPDVQYLHEASRQLSSGEEAAHVSLKSAGLLQMRSDHLPLFFMAINISWSNEGRSGKMV